MSDAEQALLKQLSYEIHGLRLDAGSTARVMRFLDLLQVWNRRLRLTGERERSTLLRKHVVDSLACVALLPDRGGVLDVGTGAGFPGAVLACVRPDLQVTLLDSKERPISFLGEVIRRIPLPRARAVEMRAEEAARDVDVAGKQALVASRAIRMDSFLQWAAPLLEPAGRVIAMQTPRVDRAAAERCAACHGLRVVDTRDYHLPDGEPRRLIIFQ